MDHRNGIRRALENDGHVVGARAKTRSPTMVEVYGALGLDFVWLDYEHGGNPYDMDELQHLSRSASQSSIEPLVRIPEASPPLVRRVLDAGIRTILVPRVRTAQEVRRAVKASRYEYDGHIGDRGVASSRSKDWGASSEGYLEREDGEVLVGVMIENREAIANLTDILSVPDLGFVYIGPSDLSLSLNHPMETDHPTVVDAIEDVRKASRRLDVPVGCNTSSESATRGALEDGYQLVRAGGEVDAVRSVLSRRIPSDELQLKDDEDT